MAGTSAGKFTALALKLGTSLADWGRFMENVFRCKADDATNEKKFLGCH